MTVTRLGAAPLVRRRESARAPLVVLAAHPDDETIGAAALLLRTPGCAVVHLTDGEPRDRALWPPGLSAAPREYAALRRQELRRAMTTAGIPEDRLFELGAADQEGAETLVSSARALAELLRRLRPKRVVTHPYEGGHPDHDACAFVARAALELNRRRGIAAPPLFEMTSYHARPDGTLATYEFLEPPASPVHTRVLSDVERREKERMLAAFETQRDVIAWFPRELERLRRAPRYDFSQPPHAGALWYERMRFPMSPERWRALAAAAQEELSPGPGDEPEVSRA